MGMRAVFRWVAVGAPFTWFPFATRFRARDVVGKEFFKQFAEQTKAQFEGHVPNAGLVQSFDCLKCDDFDPRLVDPLIRDFYEHTARYDMQIAIRWNPLVRPLGWLFRQLIARHIRTFLVPINQAALKGLDSWLELIYL